MVTDELSYTFTLHKPQRCAQEQSFISNQYGLSWTLDLELLAKSVWIF